MQVNVIKIQLRYSKNVEQGVYKTLEIGAEASIKETETLEKEYDNLYTFLSNELTNLWNRPEVPKKEVKSEDSVSGSMPEELPLPKNPNPSDNPPLPCDPPLLEKSKEHFCQMHNQPFIRREKDGSEWYSHRKDDQSWCKEWVN